MEKLSFKEMSIDEMERHVKAHYNRMVTRRSVRDFSKKDVPIDIIRKAVEIACNAPSGANKQPWTFVIVQDNELKSKIREGAEKEEKAFYSHRATKEWLDDLNQFQTDWQKPFLEDAPFIIVVFKQIFDGEGKNQKKNYYVNESVGIATGFLLTALHYAGLVALTHTPSPMGFLEKILNRPKNERAFMMIPVGYPANNAEVPHLKKKPYRETIIVK